MTAVLREVVVCIVITIFAVLPVLAAGDGDGPLPPASHKPLDWCNIFNLSLSGVISQLSQLDINSLLVNGTELNEEVLKDLIETRKIGSLFNSPSANGGPIFTVEQWRILMNRIYNLSTSFGDRVPILYGIDSVHGANYVFNATIFPHQIGCAATFNASAAEVMGRTTGLETRYAGIPWVFAPILGIAVHPSWPRVYETFGEDPLLASIMGHEIVRGLQHLSFQPACRVPGGNCTRAPKFPAVAACMKHFIGYPNSRTGHDPTPSWIPMNILLQYFLPPFQSAVDAGVLSAMEAYIELNGRPVVASSLILQFLIRNITGFSGLLVTDYDEIYRLHDFHLAAKSYEDAVWASMNATSIDMAMMGSPTPSFADYVSNILQKADSDRLLHTERLKASANRVLNLKSILGLFNSTPVPEERKECSFACPSHRKSALDVTRQSITLLQNDGVLPMPKVLANRTKISIVGEACNSLPLMAGGWTIAWQGAGNASAFGYGTTIFEELQFRYPLSTVTYAKGCSVAERSTCSDDDLAEATVNSMGADYVIVCTGESTYAEYLGNIDDLTLPGEQIKMVESLHSVNQNIIVVLVQGRPRILGSIPRLARAIVNAYLPGPSGGQAIAEILRGVVNPSGRLPITYPRSVNNGPIQYWRKPSANRHTDYSVQWEFGFGLSYSTFTYLRMTSKFDSQTGYYDVTVTIKNDGPLAGEEVVLIFSTQDYRDITPEIRMLRAFKRVFLDVNEQVNLTLSVPSVNLSYVDEFNCQVLQNDPGTFYATNSQGSVSAPIPNQILRQYMGEYYRYICSAWGRLAKEHSGYTTSLPSSRKGNVSADYVAYFVCFGAGIVGTVIGLQWLRLRNKREQERQSETNPLMIDAENVSLRTPPE